MAKRDAAEYDRMAAAMHRWVDEIAAAWPVIDRIEAEMGAGYPGQALGGTRGGGEDDGSTAAMAVSAVDDPRWDPGATAARWNTARVVAFSQLAHLARDAARLKPMSRWLAERRTDEDPGVCVGCKQPVLSEVEPTTGQTTRVLDKYGRPWHRECLPDDVDRCTECDELCTETELLDGKPYHARELGTGCYFRAYNRSRGRRVGRNGR